MPKRNADLLLSNFTTASRLAIITAITMLIWAFGSYLIYILYDPTPRVCFPLISGCAPISRAGESMISGIFLPSACLTCRTFFRFFFSGTVFDFYSRFLIRKNTIVIPLLFILGVVLCPVFLIIAEAILNGMPHNPYEKAHIIFSNLAFISPLLFQLIFSFSLIRVWKHPLAFILCILSVLSTLYLLGMIFHIPPGAHSATIMEWQLFVLLVIWIILMGLCLKKHPVLKMKTH